MTEHKERKHSPWSASGAEIYFNCPGSVNASKGVPSKDSIWSLEGTKAHEVLEKLVKVRLKFGPNKDIEGELFYGDKAVTREMINHAATTSAFILNRHIRASGSELMIEERVFLDFIHPEAFGSLDYGIVDHFATLDIMDYKYGMTVVSPKRNKQFLFYALATAHKFKWNFKRVRMWTLQPRVKGFDGYPFWEITTSELMDYIPIFKRAIQRTIDEPDNFVEGDHCHWCNGKKNCPLKNEGRIKKAQAIFSAV